MKSLLCCLLLVGVQSAPFRKPTFRRDLDRIVGGIEVIPGEIPFQLSFQDTSFGFPWHFCSASIYNENWAITAGHCVQGSDMHNPDYLQVVAGEHNLDADDGTEQVISIHKIIVRDGYNPDTYSRDIALLKLSQPLVFNEYVNATELPRLEHNAHGNCTVSGWGRTSEQGSTSAVLQQTLVSVVTDDECRDIYGESNFGYTMLCAGFPDGETGFCDGDAGGPLMCNDTGSPYLAGVASWGYGCGRPGYPGVYAEVSYHVDWIKRNAV